MKIEYRKPTPYDKRRRAGFWLGTGSFIATAISGYAILCIMGIVFALFLVIKVLNLICK